jgi:alginate O-acetyltransferase complex protein AlgI
MYEAKKNTNKKIWFLLSVIINVGLLGFFKYYDFFAISLAEALSHVGFKADFILLHISRIILHN